MSEHSQTSKEACFEEAVIALQAVQAHHQQKPPEIVHQRAWTRDPVTGVWRMEPELGPWDSFWAWLRGNSNAGRQVRYPDVTVVRGDGKMAVVDTKFDRPSGGRDEWGDGLGKFSGKDQRTDFNEINQQQTGMSNAELVLDADVCACPKKGRKPGRINISDSDFAFDWVSPLLNKFEAPVQEQQQPEIGPPPPPEIGPPPPPKPEEKKPPVEEDEDDEEEEEPMEDEDDDGRPDLPKDNRPPIWVTPGSTPTPWGAPAGQPTPIRPPVEAPVGLRGIPDFAIP